jgi:hypothetical protein
VRWIFPTAALFVGTCVYGDTKAPQNQQLKSAEDKVTPAAASSKADEEIIARAQQELEKIRTLVDAGALPRKRLEMAELAVQDAEDEAVLRQSLYGKLTVQDTTRDEVQAMVTAAKRLYDRQRIRFDEAEALVNQGVTSRSMMTPILEDLDSRRKTLDLAQSRARLWDQLAVMARAEVTAESQSGAGDFNGVKHRFDGKGSFSTSQFKAVETAFEQKFHKQLPISALGETALHKSLGFDHRGRVDVAVSPDQAEGSWLRTYLEQHEIPYFAFRAAVAGSATGPHIHMGPPSTRYFVSAKARRAPARFVAAKAKKSPQRSAPAGVVAD